MDNGPNVNHVVAGIRTAASAMDISGQFLESAIRLSSDFVARTIGGGAAAVRVAGPLGELAVGGAGGEGLSESDRAALSDYTGLGYAALNRALRSGATEGVAGRVNAVSTALGHLPDRPGVSYRDTALSEAQLARYAEGARVTEAGFTSSSTRFDGDFHGNTCFYLQGRHGKYVAPYSEASGESEVLFDHGTEFFVHTHEIDADGRHRIFLIEV